MNHAHSLEDIYVLIECKLNPSPRINFCCDPCRVSPPAPAALLLRLRLTALAILRQVLQAFYSLSTSSPCCVIFDMPLSFVSTSMPSPELTRPGDCSNRHRNGSNVPRPIPWHISFSFSNASFC